MKTNGPWKIKNSRKIYKNKWIEVIEDEVIQPDGKDSVYATVNMHDGVCVLPVDDEGYAYLTEQFRYVLGGNSLEAPSGGIEKEEDVLDAAMRELKEETGITADEWNYHGFIHPVTSPIRMKTSLYLAKLLHFGESDPESTESFKIVKMKLEDAVSMVMDGEISHGPSCVLILKAST